MRRGSMLLPGQLDRRQLGEAVLPGGVQERRAEPPPTNNLFPRCTPTTCRPRRRTVLQMCVHAGAGVTATPRSTGAPAPAPSVGWQLVPPAQPGCSRASARHWCLLFWCVQGGGIGWGWGGGHLDICSVGVLACSWSSRPGPPGRVEVRAEGAPWFDAAQAASPPRPIHLFREPLS